MLGLPHKSIFDGKIQIGSREIEGSQLKWSVFHDFPAGQMYAVVQELVFPFIKNLHGIRKAPTQNIWEMRFLKFQRL